MRITPLDVRKQEFRRGMRGLDPEEVYAFLATVADEYETVLTDNRQLRDRVLELDEKVTEYRNMEKTLRDTLLTAERVMNEARENARKEAELILRDAQVQAQQASQTSARQAETLRAQLRELRSLRDRYLSRLKSLAEAQIGVVENFLEDFEEDDREAREVEASVPAPPETPSPSWSETSPAAPPIDAGPTPPRADAFPSTPPNDSAASASSTEASRAFGEPARLPDEPDRLPGMSESGISLAARPEASAASAAVEMPSSVAVEGWNEPHEDSAQDSPEDRWRDYQPEISGRHDPAPEQPGLEQPASGSLSPEEAVAATVAEMAEAAGSGPGQREETVPLSADPGDETPQSFVAEPPEEEPAVVASAEETEESSKGSRWSISRFTRGLGDF